MDILLLGVAALVLIALTLWIVWRPAPATVRTQEAAQMLPQGDSFEDQYTSATADLSAGGVAVTAAAFEAETPRPAAAAFPTAPEPRALAEPAPAARKPRPAALGAAALLTLGGAVSGAWLYSRWTRQRNKPLNRLRRRFR